MEIPIDKDLLEICSQILQVGKNIEEWAQIESDDYFQTEKYEGGFDSTENAFCFSYYTTDGYEYWFQINLEEIKDISEGKIKYIKARRTE